MIGVDRAASTIAGEGDEVMLRTTAETQFGPFASRTLYPEVGHWFSSGI
jgi:hypothetical protein